MEKFIDINHSLGSQGEDKSHNPYEVEVVFPNEIPTEYIYGMYDTTRGLLYRNPYFVPTEIESDELSMTP